MELDKKAIKALSSDTRVTIMKSLAERRKMPAELSKELGLAGSTIVEHLGKLEGSGLVKKEKTHRKWIYYELTPKGRGIVRPVFPVQFVVMLSLGVIFALFGLSSFYAGTSLDARQMLEVTGVKTMESAPAAAGTVLTAEPATGVPLLTGIWGFLVSWSWALTLAAGLVLIFYGVAGLWSKLK